MYTTQPLEKLKFLYRAMSNHIDALHNQYAAVNILNCPNEDQAILKEAYTTEMEQAQNELELINQAIIAKQPTGNLLNAIKPCNN